MTGSGKLFRDPAQRPSHTSDRICAAQPLGHGHSLLQFRDRHLILGQARPLDTRLARLASPSLPTLALTGGAQLLHESRLLELREHASDLVHSDAHLVVTI